MCLRSCCSACAFCTKGFKWWLVVSLYLSQRWAVIRQRLTAVWRGTQMQKSALEEQYQWIQINSFSWILPCPFISCVFSGRQTRSEFISAWVGFSLAGMPASAETQVRKLQLLTLCKVCGSAPSSSFFLYKLGAILHRINCNNVTGWLVGSQTYTHTQHRRRGFWDFDILNDSIVVRMVYTLVAVLS